MNPNELSIFARRLDAVGDEMRALLRNGAFSPDVCRWLDFRIGGYEHDP
jgi:N-methylhydantoinase B/oxoprolinase/acetone carboxylase alpha subunit